MFKHATLLSLCLVGLTACTSGRPQFTPPEVSLLNAQQSEVAKLMPQTPIDSARAPGALWMSGAKDFFRDNRARQKGDIITVVVNVSGSGQSSATTDTESAQNSEGGVTSLFDFVDVMNRFNLPTGAASNLFNVDSTREFNGQGATNRTDKLQTRVAAVVTDVLPNGYMVIHGTQEVILNYELQEVSVAGIIRPEDVTSGNTIDSDKIAQARITYAGRGVVDRSQQQKLIPRLVDELSPL